MKIRSAYCIFCDDVRSELNDKLSYIGAYGDKYSVDKFPCKIKTICAAFRVDLTINTEGKTFNKVKFQIKRTDGLEYEREYEFTSIFNDITQKTGDIAENSDLTLVHIFDLENLIIEEEGIFETSVFFDDEEYKTQRLKIAY